MQIIADTKTDHATSR